jgi:hypothetical protein
MATHEEELRKIVDNIELLEAEQESNTEEMQRIVPLEGRDKRLTYLNKRNVHIENGLKELREKRKSKIEVIEWEHRTG